MRRWEDALGNSLNIFIALAAGWFCGCGVEAHGADAPEVIGVGAASPVAKARRLNNCVTELLNGSPLAALLATIEGVTAIELNGGDVVITRAETAAWDDIALQVVEALKDFFLL